MKNARIYINGNYGSLTNIECEVKKTTFTGEGSLDFETTILFEGIEHVLAEAENLDDMSDEEFDTFEEKSKQYFRDKYCKNGEDLCYMIQ